MDAVSTEQSERRARNGRAALGWAAFIAIVMVVVAAIFAGFIRNRMSAPDTATRPGLSSTPKPSPLPRPGPPRPGTMLASF